MPRLIIEICPREPRTSACLMDGEAVRTDSEIAEALADCCRSGDVQDACEYVRDVVGVEWRIIARNADGVYENRLATSEEKAATARAIYFDSENDFTDESLAETYLIWSAASDVASEDVDADME